MPKRLVPLSQAALLLIWAVFLTAVTVIFAGVPLRQLRRQYGTKIYWLSGPLVTALCLLAGFDFIAISFLGLVVLFGLYGEAEDMGSSVLRSAFLSVTATGGLIALFIAIWQWASAQNWTETLRQQLSFVNARLQEVSFSQTQQFDIELLVSQAPSGFAIIMFFSLAICLLVEQKIKLPSTGPSSVPLSQELREFRLPDFFVWPAILSLFGAFVDLGSELFSLISLNIFNVMVILYFFQGLPVIAEAFRSFRVGFIWQLLFYFLIVIQLFLVVSVLGFVDYWLDFRTRFASKSAQTDLNS